MGAKRAAASASAKTKPSAMVARPLHTKPSLPLLSLSPRFLNMVSLLKVDKDAIGSARPYPDHAAAGISCAAPPRPAAQRRGPKPYPPSVLPSRRQGDQPPLSAAAT